MASDPQPEPRRWSRDPVLWLFVAVSAAQLIPVWAVATLPSMDGPNHVENAWLLRQLLAGDPLVADWYSLRADLFPNWMSHATMALGMTVLPPAVVEKLWLSGYTLLFCAAALYLARAVVPGGVGAAAGLALLWLPMVHNLMLWAGFYNFALSVPLVMLVLGWWWRHRDEPPGLRNTGVVAGLLLVQYLCHGLATAVSMLCVVVLATACARRDLRRWLAHVAAVVPAGLLLTWFTWSRAGEGGQHYPLAWKLDWFVRLRSVQPYGDVTEVPLAPVLGVLLIVLTVSTLVVHRLAFRRGSVSVGLEPRDAFAAVAVLSFGLFVALPDTLGGGSLVGYRLALFPLVLIVPWLRLPRGPLARGVVVAVAAALALTQVGLVTASHVRSQAGLREFTSGVPLVGEGETLLPIILDSTGGEPGLVWRYQHASSHYALRAGAIDVANYEAGTDHFPLRYRDGARDPIARWGRNFENGSGDLDLRAYPVTLDWVLVWCPRASYPARPWIQANYDLAHAEGRLELYRRRSAASPAPRRGAAP